MIVLTDYPKLKHIRANYRGLETKKLLEKHKEMFHIMMSSTFEVAGGYAIGYDTEGIERELAFRNVPVPKY